MPGESNAGPLRFARPQVPDAHRLVLPAGETPRDQCSVIRAEMDFKDEPLPSRHALQLLAGGSVPEADRPVLTARSKDLTVVRIGQSTHRPRVPQAHRPDSGDGLLGQRVTVLVAPDGSLRCRLLLPWTGGGGEEEEADAEGRAGA